MTVAVIGGGAVGVTTAWELARSGFEVSLFEADRIGAGSTGRAAGVIHAAHRDALTSRLVGTSLEVFQQLSGTAPFSFTQTPYVWFVTESGAAVEALEAQVHSMQQHGVAVDVVSPAALGDRWPTVRTTDIELAAMTTAAGWLDPQAYATVVAKKARAAGASIMEDTPVSIDSKSRTVIAGDECHPVDAVVVAAGAQTKQLLATAGVAVPMKPYRVQALTIDGPSTPMFWNVSADYYARPHSLGILAGDGTERREADPEAWRRSADSAFVATVQTRLEHRLTRVGDVHRSWAGLCTATPDQEPLLGRLEDGLFVGTGWHGHGVMRAPAAGQLLAAAVEEDESPEPRFDPGRFSGDESFRIVPGMTVEDHD